MYSEAGGLLLRERSTEHSVSASRGGHLCIKGGAYVRYQNLKNTPKALISGQKAPLF